MTDFTTLSAASNMPQGDRSCGRIAGSTAWAAAMPGSSRPRVVAAASGRRIIVPS